MRRLPWLLGILLWQPLPLWAHPHLWVSAKAEIETSGDRLVGLWAEWTLDQTFAETLLSDVDANGNGQIDPDELPSAQRGYFDNLGEYQYFTSLTVAQKPVKVTKVERFQATILADRKVVYRFFVPLNLTLRPNSTLVLAFFDDTYFAEVALEGADSVRVSGRQAVIIVKPNPKRAYYMGQIVPIEATVAW